MLKEKIVKFILKKLGYFSRIAELESENKKLKTSCEWLQSVHGDPRIVMEKIFNKQIKWFDYREMTKDSQRVYFSEAQFILNSKAFNNVKNKIIATVCQEHVRTYNQHLPKDNNVARDVQMIINGIDLIEEELSDIADPDQEQKQSAINKAQ